MALHPDAATYPHDSPESKILERYRDAVDRAFNGGMPCVRVLSVATIRMIARDTGHTDAIASAEREYLRAACELIQAPTARPMHT